MAVVIFDKYVGEKTKNMLVKKFLNVGEALCWGRQKFNCKVT